MTVTFRTLYAVWIGTIFGAIILHITTGDTDAYIGSFYYVWMVGSIHFAKKRGWL